MRVQGSFSIWDFGSDLDPIGFQSTTAGCRALGASAADTKPSVLDLQLPQAPGLRVEGLGFGVEG